MKASVRPKDGHKHCSCIFLCIDDVLAIAHDAEDQIHRLQESLGATPPDIRFLEMQLALNRRDFAAAMAIETELTALATHSNTDASLTTPPAATDGTYINELDSLIVGTIGRSVG